LLWHVHQRCLEAKRLDGAVVATDDERIERACRQLGIDCIRTGEHLTGTDRVAEAAEHLQAEAYINVQGDEPFISPIAIDAISEALEHAPPSTLAVNACTQLDDIGSVLDHNVAKVVIAAHGDALMLSRQPIPYPRRERPQYIRQLGLYGFKGLAALHRFHELPQGPLERAEGVEMLRFVEHGHTVQMVLVTDDGVAVDTPEDLARADSLLSRRAALPYISTTAFANRKRHRHL
jgi:3-deoxy-manno-octulosonate cytidylyltransferase (CMP-KDO synthetase)